MKKIKKSLWITLTSVFAALTIGSFVGGALTSRFTKTINDYFGLPSFDVIEKETNEEEDLEYFKFKYTLKDGSLNDVVINVKMISHILFQLFLKKMDTKRLMISHIHIHMVVKLLNSLQLKFHLII